MSDSGAPLTRLGYTIAFTGVLTFVAGTAAGQSVPDGEAGRPPPSPEPPERSTPVRTELRAPLRSLSDFASESSSQILTATLPMVVDGRTFPPVAARATVSELAGISPASLAGSLATILSEEARTKLYGLGAEFVSPDVLSPLGLTVELDPATLSVRVTIDPIARAPATLSFSPVDLASVDLGEATLVEPARTSAGLTAAAQITDTADDTRDPSVQVPFEGFVNFGGLKGITGVFGGTSTFNAGESEFERAPIVVFRDDPQRAMRVAAGDLFTPASELGGSAPFLGVQVERSYETLQPNRNIRPTGQRSFFLERRSTVEVRSNGQLVSRFIADPGPVNLDDIPLADLSNNISITVEDDLGRREIDNFALVNDLTLLRSGITEYSASVGAFEDEFERFKYGNDIMAAAELRRGISDALTVGAHAAFSEQVSNLGVAVGMGLKRGVAFLETAAKQRARRGRRLCC